MGDGVLAYCLLPELARSIHRSSADRPTASHAAIVAIVARRLGPSYFKYIMYIGKFYTS